MPRPADFPMSVNRALDEAAVSEAERAFRAFNMLRQPRARFEQATAGLSVDMQGLGASGYGEQSWLGLEWPLAPWQDPSEGNPLGVGRYLAVLDQFYVPTFARKRLRGARLLRSLRALTNPGAITDDVPPRYTELLVRDNFAFHFPDSAISFHLRIIERASFRQGPGPFDTDSFAFRFLRTSPAILYENASFPAANIGVDGKPDYYQLLTGYVPPNRGRPYGKGLGNWGTFYDVGRAPWNSGHAWSSLDMVVDGPATVAIFAALLQTNGTGQALPGHPARTPITLPQTLIDSGISREEAFAVNWSNAFEGRVAASLVVEDV